MDLSKLKLTDWLVGGGALAYFLFMFFPWFSAGFFSISGWDFFGYGIIPLLLLLAVAVITVLPKLADGVKIPDPLGPLPVTQAALIGAGAATALVVLRLLTGLDSSPSIGLFLAIIAAGAVTAGAVLKLQGKEEIGGIGSGGGGGNQPPTTF